MDNTCGFDNSMMVEGSRTFLAPCERPVKSLGFCNTHYSYLRRTGSQELPRRRAEQFAQQAASATTCKVPDPLRDGGPCDKPTYARDYCAKHYQRYRTHGDPTVVLHRGQAARGRTADGFPTGYRELIRRDSREGKSNEYLAAAYRLSESEIAEILTGTLAGPASPGVLSGS